MLGTLKRSKYPVTVNAQGRGRSNRASPLTIPPAVFPMETEREGGGFGCPSSRANLPATGQIPQHGSHRSQLETILQSGPTGLKGEGNQKQMSSTRV